MVALRGVLIRSLGFIGNLVLARILTPRDFGLVAVGSTVLVFVNVVSGGGLGSALVRGRTTPDRRTLEAVLGVQLIFTGALAVGIIGVAIGFGDVGRVTALMVGAVPLTAFRTPGAVLLERRLEYSPIARVELLETCAAVAWSVGTAALGWGVLALATAGYARGVVGAVGMTLVSPTRVLRPRAELGRLRGLLRFGMTIQAQALADLARDQTLNIGIAALAGVRLLGLWSLANRLLLIPFLMFESLWQVSYPALARLIEAGEDVTPTLRRAVVLVASASGLLFAALLGGGPSLIPSVFGERWEDATVIIPFAAIGLTVSGPVSVSAAGYLFAVGDAGSVLRSSILSGAVWNAVTLSLVRQHGAFAIGAGLLAAALTEAASLTFALRRRITVDVVWSLTTPLVALVIAGSSGWSLNGVLPRSLVASAATGLAAVLLYACCIAVLDRSTASYAAHALRRCWSRLRSARPRAS